jgi:hypothetical protein
MRCCLAWKLEDIMSETTNHVNEEPFTKDQDQSDRLAPAEPEPDEVKTTDRGPHTADADVQAHRNLDRATREDDRAR